MTATDVSVIIPTFRREREVLEAISSVIAQRGVSLEVFVLDDSPDGSARAAVATVTDPRLRYQSMAQPSGGRPALVRNAGARQAGGRYLYFLDDDDILEEGTLAAMVQALDARPDAAMAFGVITPFGEDPQRLAQQQAYFAGARARARRLRAGWQLAACLVFRPAVLVNSACMARRAAFEAAGGFDAQIPVCEDADLWSRLAAAQGFVFLDRSVVRYRTGAPSLMHNLAHDDARLHASYAAIQAGFRRSQGRFTALAMKLWARHLLR